MFSKWKDLQMNDASVKQDDAQSSGLELLNVSSLLPDMLFLYVTANFLSALVTERKSTDSKG